MANLPYLWGFLILAWAAALLTGAMCCYLFSKTLMFNFYLLWKIMIVDNKVPSRTDFDWDVALYVYNLENK